MLNYLWPAFIIISFLFSVMLGKLEDFNQSIFESLEETVKLILTLIGTMSLWCGLMEIVKNTSLIGKIKKILVPIINFLFPEVKENEEVKDLIAVNMTSNILGLGNAATPAGIKAMEKMQELNDKKEELSNTMSMFIVINTASIQIIPTTVIAIRSSLSSNNPTAILVPVWIATFLAAIVGIFITKLFILRKEKKEKGI